MYNLAHAYYTAPPTNALVSNWYLGLGKIRKATRAGKPGIGRTVYVHRLGQKSYLILGPFALFSTLWYYTHMSLATLMYYCVWNI